MLNRAAVLWNTTAEPLLLALHSMTQEWGEVYNADPAIPPQPDPSSTYFCYPPAEEIEQSIKIYVAVMGSL